MTVRTAAGAGRPSSQKLWVSLVAYAAVIGVSLLRPSGAEAVAPKDMKPVWNVAGGLSSVKPSLPDDVIGSRARTAVVSRAAGELATTAPENTTAPLSFGGRRSGLPWASGSTGDEAFGTWRRRPQDIHVTFAGRESWDSIRRVPSYATTRRYAATSRVSLGLPMLVNEQRGDFAGCVSGVNDEHIRAVARGLVTNGAGNSVVRLGWEMNGKGFPWSVGNFAASAPLYRQCFMRLASIIRVEAPDVLIEWTPRRGTDRRLQIETLYPGDEYVDIVGLLYYDWWAASPTEADWARNVVERDRRGGPRGLATWLEFAQNHGKPLAIAEWGIGKHGTIDPFDNPLFIQKMYEFFDTNAADIAYESYFNAPRHRIFASEGGSVVAPQSAAMYLSLFGMRN